MEKIITALESQKRNPDRLNVYLNGEFAFGISKFVGAWLSVGQSIDEKKIETLLRQDEREKALQVALRYINYRQRTSKEVQDKLTDASFPSEIIEDVVAELKEKGYINDKNYASQWAEMRSAFKPRSHYLIALELKKKGVGEDVISEALKEVPNDKTLAIQFGMNYMRKLKNVDEKTFMKKMHMALRRKGFSYSLINEVMDELMEMKHREDYSEE